MAVYQIYKVLFNRSRQGNLLSKMDGRSAYDKAQELLEEMLGGVLPLTKEKRDKTLVPLENYVEKKRDGVTVMVVCNEKNHKYREKLEEHELVYHPGCRVIIDNRPGIAQLAIERSQSFDGKTDKVRDILQEAFCKLFDQYQLTVEIRAKKREGTFWEAVDEQCLTYNDRIQHVVYEFPDDDEVGPIDASRQTMDKLTLLKSLNAAMNAARGVYHAYSSKEKTIQLDKTQEDIANMVAMCCQNGYNISVHFQHYGVYRFGTDIKALSQLKDEVVKEFVDGQTAIGKTVEGEWALVHWLDEIRKVTENYKDEEPVAKKRKGSHQYQMEEESNMGRVAESE